MVRCSNVWRLLCRVSRLPAGCISCRLNRYGGFRGALLAAEVHCGDARDASLICAPSKSARSTRSRPSRPSLDCDSRRDPLRSVCGRPVGNHSARVWWSRPTHGGANSALLHKRSHCPRSLPARSRACELWKSRVETLLQLHVPRVRADKYLGSVRRIAFLHHGYILADGPRRGWVGLSYQLSCFPIRDLSDQLESGTGGRCHAGGCILNDLRTPPSRGLICGVNREP